jgi:hypothetical protein
MSRLSNVQLINESCWNYGIEERKEKHILMFSLKIVDYEIVENELKMVNLKRKGKKNTIKILKCCETI